MTILLETVIAKVESSDRPYAVRFERALFNNPPSWVTGTTPVISHINGCDGYTALTIAATSYGLFQILGAVIFGDLAFPNPISFFWYDAEQQVTQFRALVTKWGFDWQNFDFADEALLTRYATRYNGPGNPSAYADKMKTAYSALQQNPPIVT